MKKSSFICLVVIILILGSAYYYFNNINTFKIDRSKICEILYSNDIGEFDITKNLNEKDISDIVDSLNNGKLIPDKNNEGKYTSEYVEMFILYDRRFRIYKQNDGRFTVMYAIDTESNAEDSMKQTTIDSKILQSYFIKFKQLSQSLTPNRTYK